MSNLVGLISGFGDNISKASSVLSRALDNYSLFLIFLFIDSNFSYWIRSEFNLSTVSLAVDLGSSIKIFGLFISRLGTLVLFTFFALSLIRWIFD